MGNSISMALAMWISVLFFSTWLKPQTRRRIVGFGLFADITVHAVLQSMFGGDADGRAGLLLAGVLINLTMHTYRRFKGWEKLSMDGWTRFLPGGIEMKKPEVKLTDDNPFSTTA